MSVATPDGEEIAVPATLHVKVRPTGAWIYRAIGGRRAAPPRGRDVAYRAGRSPRTGGDLHDRRPRGP
uniref:Uncharacterized protein n=1 Tax=Janibacter limosus TaxID=53458 RepID=A0AC61U467_9MICO|nr:hypothetical protein [Janibacter limosus]